MKKISKTWFKNKISIRQKQFADDLFRKRDYENEIANENKNNEDLNLKKWILMKSKNILTSKNEKKKNTYFFQSTTHRQFALSSADNNSSKNNYFANNTFEISAEISIVKNAQNFLKKKKIVAIVKRILKRKTFFKSSSRDIEKISRKLRLENVANNEDLASKDWMKNVSSKKTTFNVSFLKLRIVLFILQQFDSFAQRVRFFVEKTSMKHDKENESAKRLDSKKNDDVVSNNNRANVDFDSSFKWNIENDLLRCKKNDTFFKNFSKKNFWNKITMIRTLIISNMKKFSICWKENTSEATWIKTSRSTSTSVWHVIESSSWDTNRTICCNRSLFSKNRDKIEWWISSQICHSRSTKKSCTIRCWWWLIIILNSICIFHQRKLEMLKTWRTH